MNFVNSKWNKWWVCKAVVNGVPTLLISMTTSHKNYRFSFTHGQHVFRKKCFRLKQESVKTQSFFTTLSQWRGVKILETQIKQVKQAVTSAAPRWTCQNEAENKWITSSTKTVYGSRTHLTGGSRTPLGTSNIPTVGRIKNIIFTILQVERYCIDWVYLTNFKYTVLNLQR